MKLTGINLCDGRNYDMQMFPSGKQNKVIPESFQTILRLYLRRPESKSLAPDGNPCAANTEGLLRRCSIAGGQIIPVGKETDRHWEQGEDMSMLDFKVLEYRPTGNMVIANPALRNKIARRGRRELMRKTGLSQRTIETICAGRPVRRTTLQRMQATMGP